MTRHRVFLRNGNTAEIVKMPKFVGVFYYAAYGVMQDVTPAGFLGLSKSSEGHPVADMWRADGKWREDGTEHPLDIVEGLPR